MEFGLIRPQRRKLSLTVHRKVSLALGTEPRQRDRMRIRRRSAATFALANSRLKLSSINMSVLVTSIATI